jgi:hypothetical protein
MEKKIKIEVKKMSEIWKRYTEDRICECGCSIFLVNKNGDKIKCNDCKKEVKPKKKFS